MADDYWPPIRAESPELRLALLQRFATDLAVLTAPELSQRPSEMDCCWVHYERPWPPVPGRTTTWATDICRDNKDQGKKCYHVHHQYEIFMA